jgi:hypothetical protein
MSWENVNFGIKLSPRKYFNKNYVQADLSFGRTAQKMFTDLQGDCEYLESGCYTYENLFRRKNPFFASLGISIGRNF